MKKITLIIIFIISNLLIIAQSPQYKTYSADLLVIATKANQNHQWQNKNIAVSLNYKTGSFKIIVNSSDFYNKQNNKVPNKNGDVIRSEYIFEGNMPIEQIINQKTDNQNYDLELQFTNTDISFSEMVNFKMDIMRTSQAANSYRVFTLSGILYNDEINIPAFKGYDNEIELRIIFNAFWDGE